MTGKISLSVSLEVEPPGSAASLNLMLPDAGVHGLAAPLDVLRQTDVDRKQLRHKNASLDKTSLLTLLHVDYPNIIIHFDNPIRRCRGFRERCQFGT